MNQVSAFFVEEAEECLNAVERELSRPDPDPGAVHGAVRRFRGSAQVARYSALADEARSLELALKPVARRQLPWDEALRQQVVAGTQSLARSVDAIRDGRIEQDERESGMEEPVQRDGPKTDGVVPIEDLEYRGTDALERAQALRTPLEEAIVSGEPPGAILDELFDLIRLGTK